ncbi:PAS domain S-box/diguanylate cyclase (GGDEF) domain-containing protein [Thermanaerovibrio velox DSM 12556]|uniref:PAS domain S-box/diguanylate cyclase (GGDEF) domain-containing protein n=1 Tax=Thermanaerovibrio velox DSM 12556 TaxID=926567 RepID=H0UNI4_9BACT|nr:sensor domain-containing diguanylate cyclase [Thermanaerovibrio velox]EHM09391.1 PAS domain S-box/diguanylate cyclase (GGDEF) domain-containing protein [Thermanaerovibrio velox DSM 12556]
MDRRYKDILDQLINGVYTTDLNRVITYWNRAAEKITGYSADEVVGKRCADNILVHVDGEGNNLCLGMCPLALSMGDGSARETLVYLKHKDGHRVPVQVRATPLRDEEGKIVGGVEIFEDASNLVSQEEKVSILERLAYLDELTRVGNRRFIYDTLEDHLRDLKEIGWPFGVVMMDIDHFKKVNDTYGHQAGDDVLRNVANTILSSLRSFDSLGRYGGEEFLVILRNVDPQELLRIAEKLRVLVEATWTDAGREIITVTISGGATMADPNDTPESLIKRADDLLYRSKQGGRNRITPG